MEVWTNIQQLGTLLIESNWILKLLHEGDEYLSSPEVTGRLLAFPVM